jgi:hypothetical protein
MIGPWLGTHLPVFGPDPVNRAHPLNDGLVTWWLTLPPTDGGLRWYDLLGLNHGTLANFGAGFGWRGTTRPGGFGQLTFDAAAGSAVDPASAAPFPVRQCPADLRALVEHRGIGPQDLVRPRRPEHHKRPLPDLRQRRRPRHARISRRRRHQFSVRSTTGPGITSR